MTIIITMKMVIIASGVITMMNSEQVVTEAVAMIDHIMEIIETMAAMEAIEVNGKIIGTGITDKVEITLTMKARAIDTTEAIRTTEEID